MNWQDYREVYDRFSVSVNQTEITAEVSQEVLKDFPKNLPPELRHALADGMIELGSMLIEAAKAAEGDITESKTFTYVHKDKASSKLLKLTFSLFAAIPNPDNLEETNKRLQNGFERLLSSQALVMLYAHLDAFFADTIRSICAVRPEALRSGKKIDWATALSFDNKEDLIKHLLERYVFEFGWLTIVERIKFLREEFGLEVECPDTDIELLKTMENARHITIHNGGRVSQEYIDRTHRKDLAIGQFVPITFDDISAVARAASFLASDIFRSASSKFFSIDERNITRVLRRNPLPEQG